MRIKVKTEMQIYSENPEFLFHKNRKQRHKLKHISFFYLTIPQLLFLMFFRIVTSYYRLSETLSISRFDSKASKIL